MNFSDVIATAGAQVTLSSDGKTLSVDLYSPEGVSLISALWVKLAAEFKVMYEPRWMGVPIIQFPTDIIMMQELIWRVRPDVIVECGVAHGGSAIFYASLCSLTGSGRVVGVDVEVRPHNRVAITNHSMSQRIELIEGSSIDPATFDRVRANVGDAEVVMVVLDSNHTRAHVARELALYHQLVTPGSYLVAMDGAQGLVWDIPRGKTEWREDNPLPAIHEFLKLHPEFCIDPYFTRMHVTSNPDGYLRKLTRAEMAQR
jgi:cephalosporin hydroxylase